MNVCACKMNQGMLRGICCSNVRNLGGGGGGPETPIEMHQSLGFQSHSEFYLCNYGGIYEQQHTQDFGTLTFKTEYFYTT